MSKKAPGVAPVIPFWRSPVFFLLLISKTFLFSTWCLFDVDEVVDEVETESLRLFINPKPLLGSLDVEAGCCCCSWEGCLDEDLRRLNPAFDFGSTFISNVVICFVLLLSKSKWCLNIILIIYYLKIVKISLYILVIT